MKTIPSPPTTKRSSTDQMSLQQSQPQSQSKLIQQQQQPQPSSSSSSSVDQNNDSFFRLNLPDATDPSSPVLPVESDWLMDSVPTQFLEESSVTFTGHYPTINSFQDVQFYPMVQMAQVPQMSQVTQVSQMAQNAHMSAQYYMPTGVYPTASTQRVVQAFAPQSVPFSTPISATTPMIESTLAQTLPYNNFGSTGLSTANASSPQSTSVSTEPDSTLFAPPRRNTTTGHNLMVSATNMNPQNTTFIYQQQQSANYPIFQDSFSGTPANPGSSTANSGFSYSTAQNNLPSDIPYDNSMFLQFLPPVHETPIFDSNNNQVTLGLTAHLSGQFSLSPTGPTSSASADPETSTHDSADAPKRSPSSVSPDKQTTPTKDQVSPKDHTSPTNSDSSHPQFELTFYRRNLFQISCTVSNALNAVSAASSADNTSSRSRIIGLSMKVSLSGTDETKKPKLLYTPPKPDMTKAKLEPATKPIRPKDSGQPEVIDWKRLQFNSATLHNGRRRLQNYFTLVVSVFAELDNRKRVRLVYSQSRPIVVRGRNPRFYRNRVTIAIPDVNSNNPSHLSHRQMLSTSRRTDFVHIKPESEDDPKSPSDDEEDVPDYSSSNQLYKKGKSSHDDDDDDDVGDADAGIYEYYPMPNNYYEPPVEVVYRPHAITHVASRPPIMTIESSMKRAYASVA